jgi:cytidylate kinase
LSTFLVIAHQTALSSELREALLARASEDRRAIFVLLVPATPVDELQEGRPGSSASIAEQALSGAVDALEKAGLKFARAFVGDADPLRAVQAEFERAGRTYDGVILCTLPFGTSRWLARDLPAQIEALFKVPLTHVIAPTTAMLERRAAPNTVDVITLTVRLGCLGDAIGRGLAEHLGFRYYDWEITSRAAAQAGVPTHVIAASEQAKSFVERVLERLMATGVYEDEPIGRLSSTAMSSAITALSSREYRSFIERVVLELAAAGNAVIVGHASQVLLAYEPRALKVLLTGSLERRVQRVAEQENRSLEDARKMVRDSDDERRTFFKQTYSIDLLSAENYDLALNTDHLSVEAAVELIASVAHRRTESTRDSDDDMQRVLQP